MALSIDEILALSPDASSSKAARGLTSTSQWPQLGANEAAAWGECQGSGAKPYQTQVDLSGPAFRCSCPSRKFPCKHGLALLLIRAQTPNAFSGEPPPTWVSEWLSSRAEKAQKKEEQNTEKASAPADPLTTAKREAQRWKRIEDAAIELQRWLGDLVARGLGALNPETLKNWETMAARMVDAQAPGLGQKITEAAAGVNANEQWPDRTLHRLGLIHLACEALARRTVLAPSVQADLRALVGWPYDRTEVLESGEHVEDGWTVLGSITEERDGKLVERRVWLHGQRTGRWALLLEHAFGGRGFEQPWLVASCTEATLVFFPGGSALRALVANVSTVKSATANPPLPPQTLNDEWDVIAARVAQCPWILLHPLIMSDATIVRDRQVCAAVTEGRALTLGLDAANTWTLLAATGGRAHHIVGEWNGFTFKPLSAWYDDPARIVWQYGSR